MAYIEHNWRLSDAQAITTTADSTNVIDLQSVRDIGEGAPLFLHMQVVGADFGGGATLTVSGVVADNAALTTNAQEIVVAPMLAVTNLTLYSQYFFALGPYQWGEDFTIYAHDGDPTSVLNGRRYFGLKYTVGEGALSGGSLTTKLTLDTSTRPRIYPASTSS
jgi:hypothetical protein